MKKTYVKMVAKVVTLASKEHLLGGSIIVNRYNNGGSWSIGSSED